MEIDVIAKYNIYFDFNVAERPSELSPEPTN